MSSQYFEVITRLTASLYSCREASCHSNCSFPSLSQLKTCSMVSLQCFWLWAYFYLPCPIFGIHFWSGNLCLHFWNILNFYLFKYCSTIILCPETPIWCILKPFNVDFITLKWSFLSSWSLSHSQWSSQFYLPIY